MTVVKMIRPKAGILTVAAIMCSNAATLAVFPQNDPNDPQFPLQWHLATRSSTYRAGINVVDVWQNASWMHPTGVGVRVGIIDQGINPLLPDLNGQFLSGGILANDEHAIHTGAIAGLIAAKTDNNISVAGIAPDVELAFTVQPAASAGADDANDQFIIDLQKMIAVPEKQGSGGLGVDVISSSWEFPPNEGDAIPMELRTVLDSASINGRNGLGVLFPFAVGNDASPVIRGETVIAALPALIGVSNVNEDGQRAPESNFGPGVEIAAPGDGVYSYRDPGSCPEDYTQFAGTSASAPIVAGVIALMLDANPQLEADQVRRILRHTAYKIRETDNASNEYQPATGFSDSFGYGLIDAFAAVTAATEATANGGETWPESPSSLSTTRLTIGSIQVDWTNPVQASPPTSMSGEYVSALVVRHDGDIWASNGAGVWEPADGTVYSAGDKPDPGIKIITASNVSTVIDYSAKSGSAYTYAVYAVNGADRYSIPITSLEHSEMAFEIPKQAPVSVTGTGRTNIDPALIGDISQELGIGVHADADGDGSVYGFTDLDENNDPLFQYGDNGSIEIEFDLSSPYLIGASLRFSELIEMWGDPDTIGARFNSGKLSIRTNSNEVVLLRGHDAITYDWREHEFNLAPFIGENRVRVNWSMLTNDESAKKFNPDICPSGDCDPDDISCFQSTVGVQTDKFEMFGWLIDAVSVRAHCEIPGDLNGDGTVDTADLGIMIGAFGPCACVDLDFNCDGEIDEYDLSVMISLVGTDCTGCPEDINGDGTIDAADVDLFVILIGSDTCPADINGDRTVDTADYGMLISNFGETCP